MIEFDSDVFGILNGFHFLIVDPLGVKKRFQLEPEDVPAPTSSDLAHSPSSPRDAHISPQVSPTSPRARVSSGSGANCDKKPRPTRDKTLKSSKTKGSGGHHFNTIGATPSGESGSRAHGESPGSRPHRPSRASMVGGMFSTQPKSQILSYHPHNPRGSQCIT
jgi:hypothetical protein